MHTGYQDAIDAAEPSRASAGTEVSTGAGTSCRRPGGTEEVIQREPKWLRDVHASSEECVEQIAYEQRISDMKDLPQGLAGSVSKQDD